MSTETPKPRNVAPRPRKRPDAAKLMVEGNTFQASLNACAQAAPTAGAATKTLSTSLQVKRIGWLAICSHALARAVSFLQAKYKTSTTKRLHVLETISLGEKRFVAIVAVEGKEFLIGGGGSGMSLLAQLGKVSRSSRGSGKRMDDGGGML